MTSPPRLAYLAWAATCIIWGTTYLAIRVGLAALPPALMGGVRWTIAALLLAAIVYARGERLPDLTPGATSPCRACSCSASATAA